MARPMPHGRGSLRGGQGRRTESKKDEEETVAAAAEGSTKEDVQHVRFANQVGLKKSEHCQEIG